jgi:hypothetical protein
MKIKITFFDRLKCKLGNHKWKNINPETPIPGPGESISYSNLHKCKRCNKEEWLGMGTIY